MDAVKVPLDGCTRCGCLSHSMSKEEGSAWSIGCAFCGAEEEAKAKDVIRAAKEVRCVVCQIRVAKGEGSWMPADCKICVAKKSTLNRIEATGGDIVKAAEDSELLARAEVYVVKAIPTKVMEGVAKPVGVVKTTIKVPETYLRRQLIDPELTPLLPLGKDYFQSNPHHRELLPLHFPPLVP